MTFWGFITFIPLSSTNAIRFPVPLEPNDGIEQFLRFLQEKLKIPSRNLIFGFNRGGLCFNLFQPLQLEEIFANKKKKEVCVFEISFISEIEKFSPLFIPENKPREWRQELKKINLLKYLNRILGKLAILLISLL